MAQSVECVTHYTLLFLCARSSSRRLYNDDATPAVRYDDAETVLYETSN